LYEDARIEESWSLEDLRKALNKDLSKKNIQRIEWMRGILNEEDAWKIKAVVGSEKAIVDFWCIL
jgi:hypothetical protein